MSGSWFDVRRFKRLVKTKSSLELLEKIGALTQAFALLPCWCKKGVTYAACYCRQCRLLQVLKLKADFRFEIHAQL